MVEEGNNSYHHNCGMLPAFSSVKLPISYPASEVGIWFWRVGILIFFFVYGSWENGTFQVSQTYNVR